MARVFPASSSGKCQCCCPEKLSTLTEGSFLAAGFVQQEGDGGEALEMVSRALVMPQLILCHRGEWS